MFFFFEHCGRRRLDVRIDIQSLDVIAVKAS
jgi:hypothetical protein